MQKLIAQVFLKYIGAYFSFTKISSKGSEEGTITTEAQAPNFDLQTLLKQAVYQQLFLSKDKIMGRMPQNVMQFKDVGILLEEFIEEIYSHVDLLNPRELRAFFRFFEAKFNMDLSSVREQILRNFAGMGDMDDPSMDLMKIYMVLTKLLERTREQAYIRYGLSRIETEYEGKSEQKVKDGKESFQLFAQTSDASISLLYNLCFIRLLAESFGEKRILSNAKRQITVKINDVLEKMLNL